MNKYLQSTLTVAAFATFASLASAQVTLIQENFDSYGSSPGNWSDVSGNGGTGFNGNWSNTGSPAVQGYTATNLTISTTGYVNTGLAGANSGAAGNNGFNSGLNASASGAATLRTIDQSTATTYLNTIGNTVWFSAIFQVGTVAGGNNAFLSLSSNSANLFDNGAVVVGIEGANGFYATNGDGSPFRVSGPVSGTSYLIVGRVTSGGGSDNDTLDVWFNPGDVSSIGALSTPSTSISTRSVDSSTGLLSGIQIGSRGTTASLVDSVRLAYGGSSAANFDAVITGSAIPEPSSFAALAGLGALGLVATRRRRAVR